MLHIEEKVLVEIKIIHYGDKKFAGKLWKLEKMDMMRLVISDEVMFCICRSVIKFVDKTSSECHNIPILQDVCILVIIAVSI